MRCRRKSESRVDSCHHRHDRRLQNAEFISYFFQKTTQNAMYFLRSLRTFCIISLTFGVNLGTYCEHSCTYCVRFCAYVEINSVKNKSFSLVLSHFKSFTHFCCELARVVNYMYFGVIFFASKIVAS